MAVTDSLERLVESFRHLPGIGRKSAERLAFHVLKMPEDDVRMLADTLQDARSRIRQCAVCGNLTESEICSVCADPSRDHSVICVVKDVQDVQAIENTRSYRGMYHVLGGNISPIDGIFPEDINIPALMSRIDGTVREVILATSTDVAGQATASYLTEELRPRGVSVSRIAYGIPVGTSLQFADEVTLTRALEGRTDA